MLLAKPVKKEIKIPEKAMKENLFNQPDGKFSDDYMAESENLVLFWEKSFGNDPTQYADKSKRFYPDEILREGERFYNYFVDELKFDEIKTKNFKQVMDNLKVVKGLVVINENDKNVVMSAKNLAKVNTTLTSTLNVYDIMKAGTVVLTKDAVKAIEEVYA